MSSNKKVKYIGRTIQESIVEPVNISKNELKEKKPNVLYIVLDDLGFAQLHCYGSTIDTPNIDRLAGEGLRYNNFHTTAICSATRGCLLTGANHHSLGICTTIDQPNEFPNNSCHLNPEYATLAEILHENGYLNYCVGKWHLMHPDTDHGVGPFDEYPLSKGFDHYYGFLAAQMDQFNPELVRDNSCVDAPKKASEGYHLSEDLTDNAIKYVGNHVYQSPDKPFFLYLAYGAMHAPHHAPKKYIDKYKGKFDEGWDVLREKWFQNQKELHIIPDDAELTPRNELVKAWDDLNSNQKKVFARHMEAFAGFLEHTDEQIGRVLDYLEEIEELDNTIIVFLSDNGASAEGGQEGRFNTFKNMNLFSTEDEIEIALKHFDEIGSEYALNHYPMGWANLGNVPFPWYKTWSYTGGVKDPMIIRYPKIIKDSGAIRQQYEHVIDITPTILDILNIEKPSHVKGVPQKPFHGESFLESIINSDAEGRYMQHYETFGNRAIYKDGWKAIVNHHITRGDFSKDKWELYHVEEDYSENRNVAEQYPEKLEELKEDFLVEAGKYNVFPMRTSIAHTSVSGVQEVIKGGLLPVAGQHREFKGIFGPFNLPPDLKPGLCYGNFSMEAVIERADTSQKGTLLSLGGRFGGTSWYIWDNKLKVALNYYGERVTYYESDEEIPVGKVSVKLILETVGTKQVHVTFLINGKQSGSSLLNSGERNVALGINAVGKSVPPAVSEDYEAPFIFEGKIKRVILDVAPVALNTKAELDKFFLLD